MFYLLVIPALQQSFINNLYGFGNKGLFAGRAFIEVVNGIHGAALVFCRYDSKYQVGRFAAVKARGFRPDIIQQKIGM